MEDSAIVTVNVLSRSGKKLVDFEVDAEHEVCELVQCISSVLMLPQDVRMVVANRDLQRSVAPQSPVKALLNEGAINVNSALSNSMRLSLSNSNDDASDGALRKTLSDGVLIPDAFPSENSRPSPDEQPSLQLSVRLTKDVWVPYVHKGTAVTKIEPNQGLTCGGQKVVIKGELFVEGTIHCKFGSTTVVGTFVSEKEIECFTPEHPAGVVAVEVSFDGHNFTNDNALYAFIELRKKDLKVPVPCNSTAVKQTCKVDTLSALSTRPDHT